jgi:hypothetical protein
MIVRMSPQGCDDQGRPGALAFHALFVSRWTYWRAGANPFALAENLRSLWSDSDQDALLPSSCRIIGRGAFRQTGGPDPPIRTETFFQIVQALAHGRRVAVQSTEPIDDLARAVWHELPLHIRLRASVATWAYDNSNAFDLVALPKLTSIMSDTNDLVLALEKMGP